MIVWLRTRWSIFVSMFKPFHDTYLCKHTGKILYHEKRDGVRSTAAKWFYIVDDRDRRCK